MRSLLLLAAVLAAAVVEAEAVGGRCVQGPPRRPAGWRLEPPGTVARLRGGEGGAEGQADAALLAQQREARKKAKAEEKAAKKSAKAANPLGGQGAGGEAEVPSVRFEGRELPAELYGDAEMSSGGTGRAFSAIGGLQAGGEGAERVWVRGRVQQVRAKGNSVFVVLRKTLSTVQVALFKSDNVTKAMLRFCGALPKESLVDVYGVVAPAQVEACTVSHSEILAERLYCVSRSIPVLPLLVEDAGRREAAPPVSGANETEGQAPRVNMETRLNHRVLSLRAPAHHATMLTGACVTQETRLNHRALSLRAPAHHAIMRVQGAVSSLFREALAAKGFLEIHSPKLQGGVSEGGAAVFKLDYFGRPACLAQSPQLYKQMAVMSDLERVYEIGPVFRAEQSNTHRHLCEFTGLDFEMEIVDSYSEVLDVLETALVHIFDGLNGGFRTQLLAVAEQYPFEALRYRPAGENVRLTYPEAIQLLREDGAVNEDGSAIDDLQDLSTALERQLGSIVSRKYSTDVFFLDKFPSSARPFYTMPSSLDPAYSHSFDAYVRGQEICSGSQRVHNSTLLAERASSKGIDPSSIQGYIDSFRYGASPHGGAGLGLERIVMLFLALDDVRYCSMFPRDPQRCTP